MRDLIHQTVQARRNNNGGSKGVHRLLLRRAQGERNNENSCENGGYLTHTLISTDMPGRSIFVS